MKEKQKEEYKPIPSKTNSNEVWCLWSLDKNTNQIHYLACNDKDVINALVKKKNLDLKENTVNKGPYKWNRSWTSLSPKEFEQLK